MPSYREILDGTVAALDESEGRILAHLKQEQFEDLGEKTDLSKQMPDKAHELLADLIAWRKQVNATLPTNYKSNQPYADRRQIAEPHPKL